MPGPRATASRPKPKITPAYRAPAYHPRSGLVAIDRYKLSLKARARRTLTLWTHNSLFCDVVALDLEGSRLRWLRTATRYLLWGLRPRGIRAMIKA